MATTTIALFLVIGAISGLAYEVRRTRQVRPSRGKTFRMISLLY